MLSKLLQQIRSPRRRKDVQLELISLHIPKTAGTSFRHILKSKYGEQEVIRLDIPAGKRRVRINEKRYRETTIPSGTRVVHGHFYLPELYAKFPETKDLPVITWLRDPVERVISNYFYLQKILRQLLDEEGKGVNLLSKMQRSLIEYARAEVNQNRQSKFLAGKDLEDFAFVAIQEYYGEELVELSKVLGWSGVEEKKVNVTGKDRPEVSIEIREEIARLNAADVALYQRALHLRQRRMSRRRLEIISIHVPKTAGTSFYHALQTAYGKAVSPSYRRRDVKQLAERHGSFANGIDKSDVVLHGHFYYEEIKRLHQPSRVKLITWLRDPVDRVISNYRFFRAGLKNPDRNPEQFAANQHRLEESLLTYAERPENRNVMSKFLTGIQLEELDFVGLQEHYATDLARLAKVTGLPLIAVKKNVSNQGDWDFSFDDEATRAQIAKWNREDLDLYQRALKMRAGE
ncbi:sulfotransferase family 2 domain-containing protein [Lewinella sp. 4G2]|uniref:sulfotransferase family 2 domain-containing protein n=1 Tax=Lewinella sp. 4G2 TaxID=1803372 RepID=UPI0007B4C12D|nr:sulfotransferase family 2 domain-containing protein [Lewinella sp. 4G2]OAV44832.1 hypothetical protein A3850_010170 [Lewinella sp. 4G2]